MTEEILDWLGLSLTPGVGSILFKRLLERFQTPAAVLQASVKELLTVEGLGERVAEEIRKGPFEKAAEKELLQVD